MNTRLRRSAAVRLGAIAVAGLLVLAPTAHAEAPPSARITGTVTGPDDAALPGVTVTAYRPVVVHHYTAYEVAGTALTDDDGAYDLGGLAAGTYRVQLGDHEPGVATEFYPDRSSLWAAQDLVLTDGEMLDDIDARLDPDAVVSGRVTDVAGAPLDRVEVAALVKVATQWQEAGLTVTAADGTYALDGLPSDVYRIRYERFEIGPAMTEFWEDKGLVRNATDIELGVDAEVAGIDAQLVDGEHDAELPPTVANDGPPTISGSPIVGSPLTASPGTWTPTPTEYRYQWISGDQYVAAADQTYVPTAADVGQRISVEVIAVVAGGELDHGRAQSASTEPVVAAAVPPALVPTPTPTPAPVPVVDVPAGLAAIVADLDVKGKPKVGSTIKIQGLDASLRTAVTYTFQWYAGSARIKKAMRSKLKITQAMKGKKISVTVTATAASTSKSVKLKVGRVK